MVIGRQLGDSCRLMVGHFGGTYKMKHVTYFNDFLNKEVNLNQSRIDRLDKSVGAVTSLLKSKLDGYRKYSTQGSYAHRTIIKPVKENDEFDADILVFIKDSTFDPYCFNEDYIDSVYQILKNDGNYKDKIHRKSRCVTIDYAGDCHIDVVPCVEYNSEHYICNRNDKAYELTDGDGYKDWLRGQNSSAGGNHLIKVIRILKFLRDHKDNFSIKSILLTTLIGNQVNGEFSDIATALKELSNDLNDYLQCNPAMPQVWNPALTSEDFNRNWTDAQYSNFRNKFNIYNDKINDAYNEKNHNESVKKWRAILGDSFGELKKNSNSSKSVAGAAAVASSGCSTPSPAATPYGDFL